jgi:hypothetical protein
MNFFGTRKLIIPYLPFISSDLIESRKLSPAKYCPICGMNDIILKPYGTRFDNELR